MIVLFAYNLHDNVRQCEDQVHYYGLPSEEYNTFHSIHELSFFSYFLQGCSTTLNETFGQIELTTTSYFDVRCNWKIHSAGINDAVAFITVQELNLDYCR